MKRHQFPMLAMLGVLAGQLGSGQQEVLPSRGYSPREVNEELRAKKRAAWIARKEKSWARREASGIRKPWAA